MFIGILTISTCRDRPQLNLSFTSFSEALKNSRLVQTKFLLVSKFTARARHMQGQTSNLNKTPTEFFSDIVKKNSQHVQAKMFIAHAGTDLSIENKTSTEFFSDSVKKNSQHVQTKLFIGIPAIGTCRDRPEFLRLSKRACRLKPSSFAHFRYRFIPSLRFGTPSAVLQSLTQESSQEGFFPK